MGATLEKIFKRSFKESEAVSDLKMVKGKKIARKSDVFVGKIWALKSVNEVG